jgi:hypothetical protein
MTGGRRLSVPQGVGHVNAPRDAHAAERMLAPRPDR